MNNSFIYTTDFILYTLNLFLVLLIVFKVRYDLGYPLHFSMSFMEFPIYSVFYK